MRALMMAVAALTASIPLISWAWGAGVEGNGSKTTESRKINGSFSKVHLRSSMDVTIKEGSDVSVAVTIDSNLQPLVTTEVSGDTLVIATKENIRYRDTAK